MGTGERRATAQGWGGERREGDAREEGPPGLAGKHQGERPTGARGPETRTEGTRDLMSGAVVTCVHVGRRVKRTEATGNQGIEHGHTEGKGGGKRPTGCAQKKDPPQRINTQPEDTQHRASRQREYG